MINKTLILFLLPFAIAFNSFSQISNQDPKKVEILFNGKMTKSDLSKIKSSLEKQNIQLNFVKTEFDKEGHLTSLKFSVDCNDGFKGDASNSDFSKSKRFGFFRNYDKKAKVPFGVGFI